MTLETPHCASHPSVIAVDTCQRCGRFVCGDCVTLERDETYCAECAPKAKQRTKAVVVTALVASALSVACLPLVTAMVMNPAIRRLAHFETSVVLFGSAPFIAFTTLASELVQTKAAPQLRHPRLVRATAALLAFSVVLSLALVALFLAR